jgi:hypothetical protein
MQLNHWIIKMLVVVCLSCFVPLTQKRAGAAESEPFFWLVVVKADSSISALTKKEVMGLFLGRAKYLPTGDKVKALDFPIASAVRAEFYRALTGKNIADIDAYWARLQYSGRATPPEPIESSELIMQIVSKEKRAIAYLPGYYQNQLAANGLKSVLTMQMQ